MQSEWRQEISFNHHFRMASFEGDFECQTSLKFLKSINRS